MPEDWFDDEDFEDDRKGARHLHEDDEDEREDTGTYRGGYRIYRNGIEREDFRSDC